MPAASRPFVPLSSSCYLWCRICFRLQLGIHLPWICHVFPEQESGSPVCFSRWCEIVWVAALCAYACACEQAGQCHLDYNLQEAPRTIGICRALDWEGERGLKIFTCLSLSVCVRICQTCECVCAWERERQWGGYSSLTQLTVLEDPSSDPGTATQRCQAQHTQVGHTEQLRGQVGLAQVM